MKRVAALSLTKGQGKEPGLYSSSKQPQNWGGGTSGKLHSRGQVLLWRRCFNGRNSAELD